MGLLAAPKEPLSGDSSGLAVGACFLTLLVFVLSTNA